MSIGALASATGIPVQTLRTWERRYGAPKPTRKPSGHRLYPVSLVASLRKVSHLLERGHRAGEILPLSSAKLDSLMSLEVIDARPLEPLRGKAPEARPADVPSIDAMLLAARKLDREAFVGMLRDAWIRLGPVPFLDQCAGDLMREVGVAWHAGRIGIRHEHFATASMASFLSEVREPFDRRARGPYVIAAMTPGDRHEVGLRMACVILAMRGYRLVYLGADVPLDQIAAAARERDARAVALGISANVPRKTAASALTSLRALLPRRTLLWAGGAGAPAAGKGFTRFESLAALDGLLGEYPRE